ncbi:MAG: hypothetical protein H0U99_01980, partial [Chthoniobacterales bacterium]|nr:hypothetical protein [Chthoniobacterales bacterium]
VIIVLVLAGFPIALVLAWAFDITPAGIETTPTAPGPGRFAPMRRRNNVWILGAIGLVASGLAGFFLLPKAAAKKIDKSIAVLPFESFSDEKENAFFADGIQDDILTNLARLGDLKVISRTSVMSYRGKGSSVREIGKALGVSAVLEGSVRKDKNRVRVNVQLINTENDEHLWAQEYDRDLTDIFAIQTDLAQKIASELQAKLSPSEKAQLARKPTENGEAYLAFVQAHNLEAPEDFDKIKQAEQLYERAITLDPNFALAIANLSQMESWVLHTFDPAAPRREKARALAERALKLQPDLPEAHLARGFAYYYGDRNFEAALKEFEIAQRGLPNDAEAYLAIGAIQRRQGQWKESTGNLAKAASLNPNASWPLQNLAFNYQRMRDFDSATRTVERALKIDPKNFALYEIQAKLAIAEKGDLSVAEKNLSKLEAIPLTPEQRSMIADGRVNILLFQHKFAEALSAAEKIGEEANEWHPVGASSKYLLIGVARKGLHDEVGARAAFLKAKALAEAQLQERADDPQRHCELAAALAWLGERDGAIAHATRAGELLPESKDAFDGPAITECLAQVHAILGEADQAILILDGLLTRPSTLTVELLKIDPIWDSIRHNPRFTELLAKHGAKT